MRRGHLITPFGVGALSVTPTGVSVITSCLDAWYLTRDGRPYGNDAERLGVQDWRLQKRLNVKQLRLPPTSDSNIPNATKKSSPFIPVLRFPSWHVCESCNLMERHSLYLSGIAKCRTCKNKRLTQVPWVIICESGHLDDFPWVDWTHKAINSGCKGMLSLKSTLKGQWVSCSGCGARRSMNSVLGENGFASQLEKGKNFECTGNRPWANDRESCQLTPRAVLRTASNVYFPVIETSLYIPKEGSGANSNLLEFFEKSPYWRIRLEAYFESEIPLTVQKIRHMDKASEDFKPYTDAEIDLVLEELSPTPEVQIEESLENIPSWRLRELELISSELVNDSYLQVRKPKIYPEIFNISHIRRIDTLCETRALRGFTRGNSHELDLDEGKKMLHSLDSKSQDHWLPAFQIHGEGIYLELDRAAVIKWKSQENVEKRVENLLSRVASGTTRGSLICENLDAGYLLTHTLSHLLIREMVFESGYSTSSLRERIYVDSTSGMERYGFLIYTAAGDAEGTMGGLVSLSEGADFETLFSQTLESAEWCSTDPICLELGGSHGQGPENCNLAACHACALLPETTCEDMNKFLDRGLMIGTPSDPSLGFFNNP